MSYKKPFCFKSVFQSNILPWIICGLAAAFYCYEYLLRITPGQIVPELQRAFSVNGDYLDATLISHLSLFYYYAYTPMQLPVGLLMDRYGPRWILTMAVLCCAVGTALFGFTRYWWVAAFGRFWIGFGSAFAFVGVLKLASTWLPPNRFALVSGLATTLGMIGAMLGVNALADLIKQIGWHQTVIYSSYVGFILTPIILLVVRDAPSSKKGEGIQALTYWHLWQEIRLSIKNRQIWLNGVIGGLLMAPTMVFPELWGKLYLQTVHQLDQTEASRVVTMVFLGWAVGGPLAGFFSDWIKQRRSTIIVGGLLTTISLVAFLYYPGLTLTQMKILLFLVGFTSSVEVICFAIGRENCPTYLAGTVLAFTNFLVVCFVAAQWVIAKILDFTWDGTIIEQVKIYSVDNYQIAMLVLPIATLLAFLLSFFIKETHALPYEQQMLK